MELPFQLILFSTPAILYAIVRKFQKQDWTTIFKSLGWSKAAPKYLLIGTALGLLPGFFSFFMMDFLPSGLLDQPGIAQTVYLEWSPGITTFLLALLREAFYTALGEEVFFRGFLGNLLIRRMGFAIGNLLQAILFLLPHTLILTIDLRLWPVLLPQFAAGWLFGWLLHQSGSILPGWVAHSLSNAFSALAFMM